MYNIFGNMNQKRKTYEKNHGINSSLKNIKSQSQFSDYLLTGKVPKKKPETKTVVIRKTIITKK